MVIACPSCQRKYQIDTSRIPTSGTSFTCWSCRATVRVDSVGTAVAQAAEATPPTPASRETVENAPHTAESSIPLSAMRFFESLAGEASLNQKMADQTARPEDVETADSATAEPAMNRGFDAPLRPNRAPRRSTSDLEEAARAPNATMDLLTGDDVLDLPPVIPAVEPPVETGRVVEIPAVAAPVETAFSFGEATPEPPPRPAEPATRTKAFASETFQPPTIPPPPPAPEVPVPSAFEPPPPRRPAAIPLPVQAHTPPEPPEPIRFRGARPPEPPMTATPPNPFGIEAGPVDPPGVAVAPPDAFELRNAPPPPPRMTPAEMANSQPAAWVAPGVSPDREAPPRRSLAWLALAALLVVAVCAALAWRMGLRDFFVHKPAAARTTDHPSQQQPVAPQTKQQIPAPATTTPTTPSTTGPAPAPVTPTPPAPAPQVAGAPEGDGNFTIQLRSSPNEADARSAAETLRGAGLDAYVVRADLGSRGIWFRVRVGRYPSREAASQAAAKIRSAGRSSEAIVQAYEAP